MKTRTKEDKKAVLEFYTSILQGLGSNTSWIVFRKKIEDTVHTLKEHTVWHEWATENLMIHLEQALTDAAIRMQFNRNAFKDLADQIRNPEARNLAVAFVAPTTGYQWPDRFISIENKRDIGTWMPQGPNKKVVAMTIVTNEPELVEELIKQFERANGM